MDETPTLSRNDLVFESQSDDELIGRLLECGLLAERDEGSFTLADVGRIRIIEQLLDRGIVVEDLARAVREGAVSFSWFEGILPPPPHRRQETYQELLARFEISLELATTLFEVWGVAMPGLDTRVREDDARLVEYLAGFLSFVGVDSDHLLVEGTRFLGDGARRNAHAEIAFFRRRLVEPMLSAGSSLQDVVEVLNPLVSKVIRPGLQELQAWLSRRHLDAINMQMLVQMVENALESSGVEVPPPSNPPAIAFVDISGYTRETDIGGDERAAEVASRFSELVRGVVTRHRGNIVKFLGDGVMLHFADPDDALACVRALIAVAPAAGLPSLHAGIDVGTLVSRDGDYFGRTVNIAARIAAVSEPGEILVSDATARALSEHGGQALSELGPVTLRGVVEPVSLHRVTELDPLTAPG